MSSRDTIKYRDALRKWGISTHNKSAKSLEDMYNDAVRLREAGKSITRMTQRDLDKEASKMSAQAQRERQQLKKQQHTDVDWVRQNLADKSGNVYVRSGQKNQYGEYQLWKVPADKYARMYDERYSDTSDYKVLSGGTQEYETLKQRNIKEFKSTREEQKEQKARESQLSRIQEQLKASGFEGTRQQAEGVQIVAPGVVTALKQKQAIKEGRIEDIMRKPSETIKNWEQLTPAIQSKVTAAYQKADTEKIGEMQREIQAEQQKREMATKIGMFESIEGRRETLKAQEFFQSELDKQKQAIQEQGQAKAAQLRRTIEYQNLSTRDKKTIDEIATGKMKVYGDINIVGSEVVLGAEAVAPIQAMRAEETISKIISPEELETKSKEEKLNLFMKSAPSIASVENIPVQMTPKTGMGEVTTAFSLSLKTSPEETTRYSALAISGLEAANPIPQKIASVGKHMITQKMCDKNGNCAMYDVEYDNGRVSRTTKQSGSDSYEPDWQINREKILKDTPNDIIKELEKSHQEDGNNYQYIEKDGKLVRVKANELTGIWGKVPAWLVPPWLQKGTASPVKMVSTAKINEMAGMSSITGAHLFETPTMKPTVEEKIAPPVVFGGTQDIYKVSALPTSQGLPSTDIYKVLPVSEGLAPSEYMMSEEYQAKIQALRDKYDESTKEGVYASAQSEREKQHEAIMNTPAADFTTNAPKSTWERMKMLVNKKDEYEVALDVTQDKVQEVIDKAVAQRDEAIKVHDEEAAKHNIIVNEIKLQNQKLLEEENAIKKEFNAEEVPVVDKTTGETKYVLQSKTAQELFKNYNILLEDYEKNPTPEKYVELTDAGTFLNNYNDQFVSTVGKLSDKQQKLNTKYEQAKTESDKLDTLKFKVDELNYNLERSVYEGNKVLRDLQEVDVFNVVANYGDRLSKGEYVEGTGLKGYGESKLDWLKGEGRSLTATAAKGGRGLIRGIITEPLEYVKEQQEAGVVKNPLEALGAFTVGTIGGRGIYQRGEKEAIARQYGSDRKYKWYQDIDFEAAIAMGTVATAGAGGYASAARGASGSATFLQGAKYGGQIAKYIGFGKVIPMAFKDTVMFVGGADLGLNPFHPIKSTKQQFKQAVSVLSGKGLIRPEENKKATEIFEKDRGLFVDAMRAGSKEETGYVEKRQETYGSVPIVGGGIKLVSNLWEEIPGTGIISGKVVPEREKLFKKGAYDAYRKAGYSANDASLMSEVAWKERAAGMAGEASAVGFANIGSESLGQKFVNKALGRAGIATAEDLGKAGALTIAKKSGWETAKAGYLEGVAVGAAQQEGRFQKSDYGEIAGYGLGGFASAGVIGATLGGLEARGTPAAQKASKVLSGGVYVTDPWELYGDVLERKISKGLARRATKRIPVITSTWSMPVGVGGKEMTFGGYEAATPTATVSSVSEGVGISMPSVSVTETTPTRPSTMVTPKTVVRPTQVKVGVTPMTTTKTKVEPFTMTSAPTTTTPVEEKVQTLTGFREILFPTKTTSAIATTTPTNIFVRTPTEPITEVPTMVQPYVETLTQTAVKPEVPPTTIEVTKYVETEVPVYVDVPVEIPVDNEIITEVPTWVTTTTPTTTGKGAIPYLKGGYPEDMFGLFSGMGAGGWNVENKIQDIAGQWLEGQKQKNFGMGMTGMGMTGMAVSGLTPQQKIQQAIGGGNYFNQMRRPLPTQIPTPTTERQSLPINQMTTPTPTTTTRQLQSIKRIIRTQPQATKQSTSSKAAQTKMKKIIKQNKKGTNSRSAGFFKR